MALTRTQYVANVREMMDATSSARWTDTFIKTVLGYVHQNEMSSLLGAFPYYKVNTVSATCDSNGRVAISSLTTGSGDSAKNFYRVLALTNGDVLWRETTFVQVPLATSTNYDSPYARLYYWTGDYVQVLPVTAGQALTVTVNYTPTPVDQLAGDSSAVDFPSGNESILWNLAGAELLTKGGAETDAANALRQLANAQRQQMYQGLVRRSARPQFMGFPDLGSEWAGMSYG